MDHATTLGIDPVTVEIEAAYHDALSKHQRGTAFSPSLIIGPLEQGDWWSALDHILGASIARGGKDAVLKLMGRVVTHSNIASHLGSSYEYARKKSRSWNTMLDSPRVIPDEYSKALSRAGTVRAV